MYNISRLTIFLFCRDIHVTDADAQAESGLTVADRRLLIGALEYKEKRVKDVMTALEHTFLLEERSRLNFSTMLAIYKVRAPRSQIAVTAIFRLCTAAADFMSRQYVCKGRNVVCVYGRVDSRAYPCTLG